jgi:acetyl-CoA carboxylase biotin carboxyl carrier protein
MDINEIQSLIKFVSKSGVSEVELETKGFKIVIKTGNNRVNEQPIYIQAPQAVQSVAIPSQASAIPVAEAPSPAPEAPKPAAAPSNNYVTVKSPMIGTFYRSSSPDKPQFVNVGDEIKAGDVLCIIEAMKLFNEIESEVSGKIVKVLVDDSKPVEYDQPLFLVEPA